MDVQSVNQTKQMRDFIAWIHASITKREFLKGWATSFLAALADDIY
jgi:hypothetical protein